MVTHHRATSSAIWNHTVLPPQCTTGEHTLH